MAKNSDALAILGRLTAGDTELRRMVAEERVNARVAQAIYDARTAAGLSQAQLARMIGTQQPAIARLEDADYEGHSLSMLAKIAAATGARLEVKIIPGGQTGGRGRTRPTKAAPVVGGGKATIAPAVAPKTQTKRSKIKAGRKVGAASKKFA